MSIRRPLLLPFAPLYRAGIWWSRRRARPATLQHSVLSIGSISAGGAGKTPFTSAMSHLLHSMGYTVDILSRGYGRTSTGTLRVDPAGSAATFGDEPLLLARTLNVPVYVGRSRHAAGLLAETELTSTGLHIHLLDDGFSHHALARSVDIVLLTAADLEDALLPAGNLREPIAALRRAHVLVLRADEQLEVRSFIAQQRGLVRKPRWLIERHVTLPPSPPQKPLVFSAIGRPADFEADLRRLGVAPAAIRSYPDHHRYTYRDVTDLCHRAQQAGADGFLTTEKDDVKLSRAMRSQLTTAGPLAVASLSVRLLDPESAADDLRRLLPTPTL